MDAGLNNEPQNAAPSELSVWSFLLVPPIAWSLQFAVCYALVPFRCYSGTRLPIYVVTVFAILLTFLAGTAGFLNWKKVGKLWPNEATGRASHVAFMSVMTLMASGLFSIVMIASLIGIVMFHPCWQ